MLYKPAGNTARASQTKTKSGADRPAQSAACWQSHSHRRPRQTRRAVPPADTLPELQRRGRHRTRLISNSRSLTRAFVRAVGYFCPSAFGSRDLHSLFALISWRENARRSSWAIAPHLSIAPAQERLSKTTSARKHCFAIGPG